MPFLFKLAKRLSVIYGEQQHLSSLAVLLPVNVLLPLSVLVSAPLASMAQGTDTAMQSIDTTLVLDMDAAGIDTVSASQSKRMFPYARRGRVVTWSASAGTITAEGLFTAPTSPGAYTTCAQSYAGTISCNDVIVTGMPPAPPATPA